MSNVFLTAISLLALAVGSPAVQSDQKADALLREVAATYKAAQTLSGTLTQRIGTGQHLVVNTEKIELKRPYLAHIVDLSEFETKAGITKATGDVGDMTISDSKYEWDYNKSANTYSKSALGPQVKIIELSELVNIFYEPEVLTMLQFLNKVMQGFGGKATTRKHYAGRKTIGGVVYEVAECVKGFETKRSTFFV